MNDDSDEDEKQQKIKSDSVYTYSEQEQNQPAFLSDIYYFLNKHEPSVLSLKLSLDH